MARKHVVLWCLLGALGSGASCGSATVASRTETALPPPPLPNRRGVEGASETSFAVPASATYGAALHLDAPDGPVIGELLAGAAIVATAQRGPFVEVTVPGIYRPRRMLDPMTGLTAGMQSGPLRGWIDVRVASGSVSRARETPPTVRDVSDFHARLSVAQEQGEFAWTRCGAIRVIEERRRQDGTLAATRVAQRVDDFELVGWTEHPLARRRGDNHCPVDVILDVNGYGHVAGEPPPTPEPLPAGFVEARDVHGARIEALARSRTMIYWVEETEHGATCSPWRVVATRGRVALRFDERVDGGLYRTELAVELGSDSPRVVLLGPNSTWVRPPRHGGGADIGFGCGEIYEMVDESDERIVLVRGQHLPRVRGYRPEQAESWFLSRAACETAVRAAESPDAALALAHKGC